MNLNNDQIMTDKPALIAYKGTTFKRDKTVLLKYK